MLSWRVIAIFISILLFTLTSEGLARSVFLNGTDISNLREQTLNQVTVRIDASGDIRIDAPHYQIQDQSRFHPIGKPLSSRASALQGTEQALPSTLPRHPEAPPVATKPSLPSEIDTTNMPEVDRPASIEAPTSFHDNTNVTP
jgi:hypothetical protein